MKPKISIVGAGIGGIATAVALNMFSKMYNIYDSREKIDIYYDPNVSIEKVGQGSTVGFVNDLIGNIGSVWIDNKINATPKTGALYEGWGKKNDIIYNPFAGTAIALHYQPNLLSEAVLNSNCFNAIEKSVDNLDDIDADYIFDCRGKHLNQDKDYYTLVNPLNSVLIGRKEDRDYTLHYTKCVATPDGWCFVIPNIDSVSYGYMYNNTITSKEEATKNFCNLFDLEVKFDLNFKNYVAKNMWHDDRVILNGNRYAFIEPLEATSVGIYRELTFEAIKYIFEGVPKEVVNKNILDEVKEVQTFILWHYQYGSKYDTPFWDYAKSLPFNEDAKFKNMLNYAISNSDVKIAADTIRHSSLNYGQWTPYNFKNWYEGVENV